MTTDASTATNPTTTDTDTTEAEKRRHSQTIASRDALDAILQHPASTRLPWTLRDEGMKALAQEAEKRAHAGDMASPRIMAAIRIIAKGPCATQPYAKCPGCYTCIAREALQGSDTQ